MGYERKANPGYHAFTGSDCTAFFSKKGKVRLFKYLKKDETIKDMFTNMEYDKMQVKTILIKSNVIFVYGKSLLRPVDETRLDMFL